LSVLVLLGNDELSQAESSTVPTWACSIARYVSSFPSRNSECAEECSAVDKPSHDKRRCGSEQPTCLKSGVRGSTWLRHISATDMGINANASAMSAWADPRVFPVYFYIYIYIYIYINV